MSRTTLLRAAENLDAALAELDAAKTQARRMEEALRLTEGNLSSLIAARHCDAVLMTEWRETVRKALGK